MKDTKTNRYKSSERIKKELRDKNTDRCFLPHYIKRSKDDGKNKKLI